jgi:hypothetical protein
MLYRRGYYQSETLMPEGSNENKFAFEVDTEALARIRERHFVFEGLPVEKRYAAFLDVLGFGSKVVNEFDRTLELYQKLIDKMCVHEVIKTPDTQMQIYSDSVVLVSSHLSSILLAAQMVQCTMLQANCLVRGGVAYGRHLDVKNEAHTYIVSEALVNAVATEKEIKVPCVALHSSVQIPDEWWQPKVPPIMKTVVHFRGRNVVSPLMLSWGRSAVDIAHDLKGQNPEHAAKYEWFIELCESILEGERLVPPDVEP